MTFYIFPVHSIYLFVCLFIYLVLFIYLFIFLIYLFIIISIWMYTVYRFLFCVAYYDNIVTYI